MSRRRARIERLCQAALGRPAEERAEFLAEACGEDEALRREVESLLEQAPGFLQKPALEVIAQESAREPDNEPDSAGGRRKIVPIGQIGSRYHITRKLGAGGMGEVYLAEDTALDRKVALKFLPAKLQQDETARKRFIREAKSAAALDHPFICSIYEVARTDDGQDFICMEYVEGKSLSEKLAQGPLPLRDALQIGLEVAHALEKAHQRGIVHRDLKPANIMLTPDSHPKVMDFGLAKKLVSDDGTEQDITSTLTREGGTLGTLAYMSPEQVKGERVDHRSDIFSFGVVLYEMLTAVHPFRKETQAETTGAILRGDPPPISQYLDDVPELLRHTVEKMLAKVPGRRYQAVHEVQTNLAQLMEETGPRTVGPWSTAHPKIPGLRPGYWALAATVLALAAVLSYRLLLQPSVTQPTTAFQNLVPLTTYPGREAYPAFSPDGRQVAFMGENDEPGNLDIYIKEIGSEAHHRRTFDPAMDTAPAWSPDGKYIAFLRAGPPGGSGSVHLIEPLAGPERELARLPERVFRRTLGFSTLRARIAWTRDSQRLILADTESPDRSVGLFLLSIVTVEKTRLTDPSTDPLPGYRVDVPRSEEIADASPSLSPDGRTLAFVRGSRWAAELYLLPLTDDLSPAGKPKNALIWAVR